MYKASQTTRSGGIPKEAGPVGCRFHLVEFSCGRVPRDAHQSSNEWRHLFAAENLSIKSPAAVSRQSNQRQQGKAEIRKRVLCTTFTQHLNAMLRDCTFFIRNIPPLQFTLTGYQQLMYTIGYLDGGLCGLRSLDGHQHWTVWRALPVSLVGGGGRVAWANSERIAAKVEQALSESSQMLS